jgi:N6-L-threonylcarbamoyladenine synthase
LIFVKVLGIETSCDETAVAVVEDGWNVLSNTIHSSVEDHKQTGGIVPEVAARDSAKSILPALEASLSDAKCTFDDIDIIAVTTGPGLMGSLLVGVETARVMACIHQKPLVPVCHICGHVCSNRLLRKDPPDFPVLVLTASGGHNELILWKSDYEFEVLGYAIDDSAGEAFDKAARMLGLSFPGGPEIERLAKEGYSRAFSLPRPMINSGGHMFSFSGLKTALSYKINELKESGNFQDSTKADLAASFQEAVTDTLTEKLFSAFSAHPEAQVIHLSGGVSANVQLRQKIYERAEQQRVEFHFPEKMEFCTDNAAMIASAGYFKYLSFPNEKWDFLTVQPTLTRELF